MHDWRRVQIRSAVEALARPTRFDAARWFDGLFFAALGMTMLTLGMYAIDDRMLNGEPVWLKPFKFAVSFAILFVTLAWASKKLSGPWRKSLVLVSGAGASAAAFFFEMSYISAQAARQELSHFNETTPFHEMMYGLMGTGATVLMLTVSIVAVAILMDRDARIDQCLRLSIGLGFLLTVGLTFWVAGELAGNGGRYIGTPSVDGSKVPIVGWSMEAGDLRPAHFFALHAMQVLPALGYVASRFGLSQRLLWIATVLYASFTILVFMTALRGIPLISS
jgi:hypothetical protein